MGCSTSGLARVWLANQFRIHPAYWLDATIDLGFSLGNTLLRGVQSWTHHRRIHRVELPDDPLFIIGHWRTGTTMLHELLACDERNRCPTTFECFLPNHFLLSEPWIKSWSGFVLPARRGPDNMAMSWDRPQEDEFALCNLGLSTPYWRMAFPNREQDDAYFELDDVPAPQRERWLATWQWFLKCLMARRPGRLVLKSPPHTFRLPWILQLFPRARFVYLVREPCTVFRSTVRLWKSVYSSHGYQKPRFEDLDEFVLATFMRMHDRYEATRGLVPDQRRYELSYEQLVRDPLGELRKIYDRLGLGDFQRAEPAFRQYLGDRSDYKPNRHAVDEQLRAKIHKRWGPYCDRHGYVG